MTYKNEIRNTVAVERHPTCAYTANSIARMCAYLLVRHPKASHNHGQSQTNIRSMILYGNNDNPSYNNGPGEYNYCRSHTNLDFGLYHALMSIAYGGCDESKLEYNTCYNEQQIFNAGIMAISNNLGVFLILHIRVQSMAKLVTPSKDVMNYKIILRSKNHTFNFVRLFKRSRE